MTSLLIGISTFAQESPLKQINQIKRDNSYLYAEATMENADDALDVARELLMKQVLEYVESNPKLSQSKDVIVKNVNANSASLSMKRGPMFRIFVYVKKSDIEGVRNATALNTIDGTSKVVVEQPVPPIPVLEKPAKVVEQLQPKVDAAPVVKKEEPVAEKQPIAKADSPKEKKQFEAKVDASVEEKKQPASMVEEERVANLEELAVEQQTDVVEAKDVPVQKVEVNMPVWQSQAIKNLMDCSDIASVKSVLNRMKAEYKIKKYGTPDNCPNPDKAYWIIIGDEGAVSTVLGPGTTERVSFRNMELSRLDDYKGMQAIWFNLSK